MKKSVKNLIKCEEKTELRKFFKKENQNLKLKNHREKQVCCLSLLIANIVCLIQQSTIYLSTPETN